MPDDLDGAASRAGEPPTNMSAKSESRRSDGQSAKSALARPVVVMIETTWKAPTRTAASPSAMPYAQTIAVDRRGCDAGSARGRGGTPRRARAPAGGVA